MKGRKSDEKKVYVRIWQFRPQNRIWLPCQNDPICVRFGHDLPADFDETCPVWHTTYEGDVRGPPGVPREHLRYVRTGGTTGTRQERYLAYWRPGVSCHVAGPHYQ